MKFALATGIKYRNIMIFTFPDGKCAILTGDSSINFENITEAKNYIDAWFETQKLIVSEAAA